MRNRIADVIVLAMAMAIALFALVAVSNSHPSGQYRADEISLSSPPGI